MAQRPAVTTGGRWRTAAGLVLAVVANSCGGSSDSTTPTAPPSVTVASVVVSGWLQALRAGGKVQLSATAIWTDGSSRVVTAEATWESSNSSVATVQAGEVTALSEGFAVITAHFEGKSGSQNLPIERGDISSSGLACGFERWAVKTLSDPNASSVDLGRVQATTIKALNELPTHCTGLPVPRAFAEEFQVYEVVGRITYVRFQSDRDYHVVVADPSDSGYSIVTEVADSACSGAINSPHHETLRAARASFVALLAGQTPTLLVGATVKLRGVGFYDFDHRQIGRSRNCMELHPVTYIERLE